MQKEQLARTQHLIDDVLKLAKQKGASAVEASISKVTGIAVSSRMQQVENLEFTNDGGLGISVYKGKRKGSASTADLSQTALAQTVEKALQIANHTSEDDCAGLADASLMVNNPPDLDLYHPVELDTEEAIEEVIRTEHHAFEHDSRITNSDGASYNANLGFKVYANSHGVNVGYPSSRYSLSCMLIAEHKGQMQRDYAYTVARKREQLLSPAHIGQQAADATLKRLGARAVETCKTPVILHRDIASGLFGHLVSAISGGSLYRKSSFLLDHLGKQILPDWLNIYERPHIQGGLASSAFDSEGVATHDMDIVEQGVLQHYLYTSYSARKLNTQTNGHAGGIHNWLVQSSGQDDQALLNEMGTGLLVTELMGQGVNIVTGDYSRGAAGFWVENGQIQYPVQEVTIAGNLKDMLANIVAIGSETETRGSVQTGSILLEKMQLAG